MTLLQAIREEFTSIRQLGKPGSLSSGIGAGKPVSRVERMLLIASAAQLLAGPGKNPTRAQLVAATRGVNRKLASGVSGSWESGSFWKKVGRVAKQAGRAAVRAAPAAAKWAGRNPHIVLPLATGALASPFLIKAITAASKTPQAQQEAAEAPPPPPQGQGEMTVTADAPPPAEGEGQPAEQDESMMGICHSWDEMHGALTEEEVALAESGGSSEQEALLRTRGSGVVGGEISHDGYRATVLRRAQRLAGGDPSTKHFFMAERQVKQALRKNGVKISIPGARPSRRTA